jgi:hypothetical protein
MFFYFLFFLLESPIIAGFWKSAILGIFTISLALKALSKAFEIKFSLSIIALLILKRYYKYLS